MNMSGRSRTVNTTYTDILAASPDCNKAQVNYEGLRYRSLWSAWEEDVLPVI